MARLSSVYVSPTLNLRFNRLFMLLRGLPSKTIIVNRYFCFLAKIEKLLSKSISFEFS